MTTLTVVDGGGETRTEAVARRLRGQLAERRISGLQLAAATGIGRSAVDRRLRALTSINFDELDLIEQATGISADYLATGRGPTTAGPDEGPDGGGVRHQGLEPRTR